MYKKISHKITSKLVQLDIIKSCDYDIYKYGVELLVSLLFTIIFILIISAFLKNIIETLFFLFSFLGTRGICGGYHTKHYYSCFVGTLSIYISYLLAYYLVQLSPYGNLIFFPFTIISAIIVVVFAPVENLNNPMTAYRRNKNRLRSRSLSVLLCLLHFISLFFHLDATINIAFYIGFIFAAITVLAAKIEIKISKRKEQSQ